MENSVNLISSIDNNESRENIEIMINDEAEVAIKKLFDSLKNSLK